MDTRILPPLTLDWRRLMWKVREILGQRFGRLLFQHLILIRIYDMVIKNGWNWSLTCNARGKLFYGRSIWCGYTRYGGVVYQPWWKGLLIGCFCRGWHLATGRIRSSGRSCWRDDRQGLLPRWINPAGYIDSCLAVQVWISFASLHWSFVVSDPSDWPMLVW